MILSTGIVEQVIANDHNVGRNKDREIISIVNDQRGDKDRIEDSLRYAGMHLPRNEDRFLRCHVP